jgi:hypothetical protein
MLKERVGSCLSLCAKKHRLIRRKEAVFMKRFTIFLIFCVATVIFLFTHAAYGQLSTGENLEIMLQRLAALNDTGELDRLIAEGKREVSGSQVSAEKCLELGLLLSGRALFGRDQEDVMSSWQEAIHYLEKAVTLSPGLATAHAVLGHLYLCPYLEDEQAFGKAKHHFEAALALDPNESVAKEGMRRVTLRSSPMVEKERFFQENLDNLARVTRSGRAFSILNVKIRDSLQHCDLMVEVEMSDVSRAVVIDSVEAMKYMGGVAGAKKPASKRSKTISSIIQVVGEVSGVSYSSTGLMNLELDRIGIVLHVPETGPTRTIFIPVATFEKFTKKQMSTRQLFGTMTFLNE